ncbi:FAD-dependent oxidoreductase [Candidatus Woesearchaeota archaeon]|jgi:thioredoxin reductase (NADPH)|nr:FAD-dependent oxidoreductase [Candidatus Woesearchaeota archaeon]MBT5215364.1 FAD-dependent oxidoreductase [Candidatus Woesearchaeota archaeon]MBT6402089.1 FAD-dependent oxidoreductase [Candidatus Woesearchaeota archaeon]
MKDVIILGGGAAGLGAALYSARFSLDTICIAKEMGGTGNIAHKVDNWIGEPGIGGMALMDKFIAHVKEYKVPLITDTVKEIKKIEGGFEVICEKESYQGRSVIFAMGMKHRELGIPGEKEFSGKGVHYCYTCDGPLYKDSTVAVVGGSDSAALGAIFMKDYAKKVYVVYRGDKLRAEPFNSEQVYADDKTEVIHNANVVEVLGDKMMTKVKLDNGNELELDGLFIEIGHIPLNELAVNVGVKLDSHGFIEVNKEGATNVEGFFAAGDITDSTKLKQFITSASEGSIAAQGVYNYITRLKK